MTRTVPGRPSASNLTPPKCASSSTEIARRTALAKFRFGTPGYDRWAVVYGRIQARKGDDARKAPANLVIRGASVIVFLNSE